MYRWHPFAMAALLTAVAAAAAATDVRVSPAVTPGQAAMVEVTQFAPRIREDIRYAGSENFVGRPIDGYAAPKCYLLRRVATALARIQRDLQSRGLVLQVFDCYRPARAVQDFVRWARDPADQRNKARYYPGIDKPALFPDYISPQSGHSRGATIDLTLLRCRRADCIPLDMGTGFDAFSPRAHTDAAGLTATQRANRQLLRRAMQRRGFANYPLEWWHYTFQPEPTPRVAYDFIVR